MSEKGRKYDTGKPRITLLPLPAVLEVVAVLEYGAAKYDADNWRKVRPRWRYVDAALRHIFARVMGETHDPESGLLHWAHAIACLLFLTTYDLEGREVPRTFEATSLPEPEAGRCKVPDEELGHPIVCGRRLPCAHHPEPRADDPRAYYLEHPDRMDSVDALRRELATMFRPPPPPKSQKPTEGPSRPAIEPRECGKCGRNLGAFHPLDVCFDCRGPELAFRAGPLPPKGEQMPCHLPGTGWGDSSD